MKQKNNIKHLDDLSSRLDGELKYDVLTKILFSTDASAYKETPTAVVFPKSINDVHRLVAYAHEQNTSIIARGAGTSLAGQVVGKGIVVDFSKYMNRILEVNAESRWVRVEPGVVLAELNKHLASFGLMFGPETSTANRCTLGGMLGNNACGLHSLAHGSVREHILETKAILSDNSEVVFGDITKTEFAEKCTLQTLEGQLYAQINALLSNHENREEIAREFPDESVPRRNHGYAIDRLSKMQPFNATGEAFNFAKLIAGSEGTLAVATELKLNLVPLPPKHKALLVPHFHALEESFEANLIALKYNPSAIELMDKTILDLTKGNIGLQKLRFFVNGDPEGLLIIELWSDDENEIIERAKQIEAEMRNSGYGYHFPILWGADIPKVWNLRTAGLGVLSNMPGDAKPVSVIEDTAVPVQQLPAYLKEFKIMLDALGLKAVYHAHIATGELHLRPIINLKTEEGVQLFRNVAIETAKLVKKYRGSLSGEHGDGRLRGEFIPFMLGEKVYAFLNDLKKTWDPSSIFNPGKITNTPLMSESLRYVPGHITPEFKTFFDYKMADGMARAIEKCNGSGDCRKSEIIGGTMCPSFMATRNEQHSTRGRANVLRELITQPEQKHLANSQLVLESLDLCLSCKACKSECPSGVDMAKLKAEYLQSYYSTHRIPFRTKVIAYYPHLMEMASKISGFSNYLLNSVYFSGIIKKTIGFAAERPLPHLSGITLKKWSTKHKSRNSGGKKVYLFNDEFLNTGESHIGIKAIRLLEKLGYEVIIPVHTHSGRTFLSKGLVKQAAKLATKNVMLLKDLVSDTSPIIGIEPSAILSFRDEYLELVPDNLKETAASLAKNALLLDEFIVREMQNGNISSEQFTNKHKHIRLHGHCHQKAIASTDSTKTMLQIPSNYKVTEIPSGCCGMAGSFGYEKEHYALSQKIGELVLFPVVRKANNDEIISAPGTSCREQILHGTGRQAFHPVEILFDALK